MTTQTTITGVVVDREHKDGTIENGPKKGQSWNRYGFQIAGSDGKHWYSSFDSASWEALLKGKAFQVLYSTKDNPSGGNPFRNVEWWKEVELEDTPAPVASNTGGPPSNTGGTPDNSLSIDKRIAWNSSVNNAVHLHGPVGEDGWNRDAILSWAEGIYAIITTGPPVAEPEPHYEDPRGGQGPAEPSVLEPTTSGL